MTPTVPATRPVACPRLPIPLRPLTLALCVALSATAKAQQHGALADHDEARRLDTLVVTASPLKQTVEDLARPVEVISGERLDAIKSAGLGDTLANVPGVHSSAFAPGASRPVIRGLDGARVQVLSGGVAALDVSTISGDHAVSIEPFLADQIEVLKGPASLLYGSGAIGGAVNAVDGRIHETLPERAIGGRIELRGNSVSDEFTGMARLDGAIGQFAWHLDYLNRDTSDFDIPGFALAPALRDEDQPGSRGTLENSALETETGAFGLSWIGERGFIGAAISRFETEYGIPEGAHGEDEGDEEEEEGPVRIDLGQTRWDFKAGLFNPFAGHESAQIKVATNNYKHLELEGDQTGTRFDNDAVETRLELVHREWGGWTGAYGTQVSRRDFSAVGEEAFVPPNKSRDWGLFWLEQKSFGRVGLELGARFDRSTVKPEQGTDLDFELFSFSTALRFEVNDDLHLNLGLDRAERAPAPEELLSDGPHVATQGFEIGDPDLGTETANRVELGLHLHHGPLEGKLAVYHSAFDDFIFLADTDEIEDGLPVRLWTQADAKFTGYEIELTATVADNASGEWTLKGFADSVRGRLDAGGSLPRIPARRIGGDLGWRLDRWRASVGVVRYADQDRSAAFEPPSDGYTLVNAHLAYHWDGTRLGWELFLDGNNLADQTARAHTSFLKQIAPLPGRSLAFGIRAFF